MKRYQIAKTTISALALIFLCGYQTWAADTQSVAVLPLRLNAPGDMDYLKGAYRDIMAARLSSDVTIAVVDTAKVNSVLEKAGGKALSEEGKKEFARETGASFVVDGSLSVIGDELSLDSRIIKVDGWVVYPTTYRGKGVGTLSDMLDKMSGEARSRITGKTALPVEPAEPPNVNIIKKETPAVVLPTPAAGSRSGWKSQRLPVALKAICVADLDNDGGMELVGTDSINIYIYAIQESGLKLKKEVKGSTVNSYHAVSVGDFNGNGLPEIYISGKYTEKAGSLVMEYSSSDLIKISKDQPWFFRVIDIEGKKTLIGERYRHIDGFYGGIKVLKWQGGGIVEDHPLDAPKWMDLYGFAIFDVTGDGKSDFISINDSDHLKLFEKDETGKWIETWKSSSYYGGSTNNIEYGPSSPEQKVINVKPNIFFGKMAGERSELIVVNNVPPSRILGKITYYVSGDIRGLTWNDVGLEDIWRTKKISGQINDYVIADINKDGLEEIVTLVQTKPPSMFNLGESLILALYPDKAISE